MTATTSTILIEGEDGEKDEISGVMYAEETTHPKTGIQGVAVQYAIGDEREAKAEFIEGKMWGVYDDLGDDRVSEEYLDLVQPRPTIQTALVEDEGK